jgi:chemotaxis protein MotB
MLREKDAQIAQLESQIEDLEMESQADKAKIAELNEQLSSALADYEAKEQVWLEEKESHSVVTVSDAVLFNSGSTTLSDSGKDIIDKIAGVAKNHPDREIRVEGHTDNKGILTPYLTKYPSNWELAAHRACAVVHYMVKQHSIDPQSLSAVGYGEYRPIADNDTSEGRAENRRVVIAIGPKR